MHDESKEAIFMTQMMDLSESMSDKMADKVDYGKFFFKRGRRAWQRGRFTLTDVLIRVKAQIRTKPLLL